MEKVRVLLIGSRLLSGEAMEQATDAVCNLDVIGKATQSRKALDIARTMVPDIAIVNTTADNPERLKLACQLRCYCTVIMLMRSRNRRNGMFFVARKAGLPPLETLSDECLTSILKQTVAL